MKEFLSATSSPRSTLAAAAAITSLACLAAPGVASGQAIEIPCSLAQTVGAPPGVIVTDEGGIAVVAPGLGEFAGIIDYRTDGPESLLLRRLETGLLEVRDCGSDLAEGAAAAASPSACNDDAFHPWTFKWDDAYRWRFNANETPGEISQTNAEEGMRDGVAAIPASHNDCGLADNVSATQSYLGGSTARATLCSRGQADGVSVVDFGAIDKPTVLARACPRGRTRDGVDEAVEVDIRFDRDNHQWTKAGGGSGCTNQWSVTGVMAHEAGHAFGLKHVPEGDHGNLTMSPQVNGPCQQSENTLGYGDVLGLRARY